MDDAPHEVGASVARWRATCAYHGPSFSGWQSQPDGLAVQDAIERVLARIFGRPVRVHGSSRTDAGVSARGQVFHFDAEWKHGPEKLRRALGSMLREGVWIYRLAQAEPGFHARYSAIGKRYRYTLVRGEADPFEKALVWEVRRGVDTARMQAAADRLTGTHDFTAFSAASDAAPEDAVKTLHAIRCLPRGRRIELEFHGSGFLYKMVRSLTGFLVRVGEGRAEPEDATRILESRVRTREVETAPAGGLCLDRVYFHPKTRS
jgi:tRNA pseudouridine38-40 synthase